MGQAQTTLAQAPPARSMKIVQRKLSELRPYADNPREISASAIAGVAASPSEALLAWEKLVARHNFVTLGGVEQCMILNL